LFIKNEQNYNLNKINGMVCQGAGSRSQVTKVSWSLPREMQSLFFWGDLKLKSKIKDKG